jgi:hypothetical protein
MIEDGIDLELDAAAMARAAICLAQTVPLHRYEYAISPLSGISTISIVALRLSMTPTVLDLPGLAGMTGPPFDHGKGRLGCRSPSLDGSRAALFHRVSLTERYRLLMSHFAPKRTGVSPKAYGGLSFYSQPLGHP